MLKTIFALVPYISVALGLSVFRNAWAAIITYHASIVAIALLLKPVLSFSHPFRNSKNKILPLSVIFGTLGGISLYLLWPWVSVPTDVNAYLRSIGLTDATWPCFIAYYVLVNPLLEEYYWRGFLGSQVKYPLLNDFLFAGYHLLVLAGKIGALWMVVVFVVLSTAAWYWRQISRITDSLVAAILSHQAADLTVILAIYLMTSTK